MKQQKETRSLNIDNEFLIFALVNYFKSIKRIHLHKQNETVCL